MLTVRSSTFACTREQAQFVAECAELRQITSTLPYDNRHELYRIYLATTPRPECPPDSATDEDYLRYYQQQDAWNTAYNDWQKPQLVIFDRNIPRADYDAWEDAQTAGGGARICFCEGIAWVSAHSGYAWADVTDTVCEFFLATGCRPIENEWQWRNPRIYGYQDYLKSKEWATQAEAHNQRDGD